MAQKVSIELLDDLDGKPADETVTYGLDGTQYEIDLSEKNAEALRKALAKYVEVSRKVQTRKGAPARKNAATGPAAAEVRAWAQSNGYEVPERGRIPAAVREAFDAAN